MKPESFEKLILLKRIIGQMSLGEKVAFVSDVCSRLSPDALKTSDGHAFTEENILSVALGALVTDDRHEFEAVAGFYDGGYQSAIRKGLYHRRGDIPNSIWRKEIRTLFHTIKEVATDLKLPQLKAYEIAESY